VRLAIPEHAVAVPAVAPVGCPVCSVAPCSRLGMKKIQPAGRCLPPAGQVPASPPCGEKNRPWHLSQNRQSLLPRLLRRA
jgi:hypothetical protein